MSFLEDYADRWTPEPNTGCFIWFGNALPSGRGRVSIKGKMTLATRVVLSEAVGPPPQSGLDAAHDTMNGCCGPACINPEHLRWATRRENCFDRPLEKRKAIARAAADASTKEQRRSRGLASWAGMTKEQRTERAKRANATRRNKL